MTIKIFKKIFNTKKLTKLTKLKLNKLNFLYYKQLGITVIQNTDMQN